MKNKEIAEILNITPAAVSMALNNKGGVSEEKREKIFQLKYETSPNEKLNSSVPQKGRILFSIHKRTGSAILETQFFAFLMSSIQEEAERYGYLVDIVHYDQKLKFEDFMTQERLNSVQGIIVLATEMNSSDADLYYKLGKDVVYIDNWFARKPYDCVVMDNVDGIMQAVYYAYRMGHREIGFIGNPEASHNFVERYEGYRRAMHELRLPVDANNVYSMPFTTDGAYTEMRSIIRTCRRFPSCLIVGNDIMAIGVMNALKYAGYSIPKDISVIGFDDMPVSRYFDPPITSVGIQDRQIGKIAVRRLMERIEQNKRDFFVKNLVGVELQIRKSVLDLRSNTDRNQPEKRKSAKERTG